MKFVLAITIPGDTVANLIEADLLIILTDVAGLLSADPRVDPAAKRIESPCHRPILNSPCWRAPVP